MMNGDYRPMAFREGNYAAVAAMNASPTRKVSPALVVSAEDPRFEGKFNGHTHMGMLGPPWRSSTSSSTGRKKTFQTPS
jgi:hypothetical protein